MTPTRARLHKPTKRVSRTDQYARRRDTVRDRFLDHADALLITDPVNIFYLTGFRGLSPEERECSMLLKAEDAILVIPRMYREQAGALPDGTTILVDEERDGLLAMCVRQAAESSVLAFEEEDLTVAEYTQVREVHEGDLVFGSGLVESARVVKDDEELDRIRKAVRIADDTFVELIAYLHSIDYTSLTELDIADRIVSLSRSLGGEGMGFDPIVASGPGASEPHYRTSAKRLAKGEVLLMDFGIRYGGYTSDLTRTVVLGTGSPAVRATYEHVLACNQASLAACKPGASAGDLHRDSVAFFAERGLAGDYLHGLGHGVGLDIHEQPFFRPGRDSELKAGMTVTIEPGLYYPGRYGVRIEDFVLVTDSGCEVLSSRSPKEYIEIR
jgi:Xaa-Pro aminopeptidase